MSLVEVFLRALEPSDIDFLFEIENNSIYWNYANRTEPFSRDLLKKFIKEKNSNKDAYKSIPPELYPFYKDLVNKYFKTMK